MSQTKLTPELIEKALKLQRLCWTQARIAEALGIHRNTLSRALGQINARAFERLVEKTAAIKARQVAQLEWVAEEAARAWEQSKTRGESVRTKTRRDRSSKDDHDDDGDETLEVVRETRERDGDPRFLREVRGALAEMRRVLGIEKPEAVAPFDLAQLTAEAQAEALRQDVDEQPRALPPGR